MLATFGGRGSWFSCHPTAPRRTPEVKPTKISGSAIAARHNRRRRAALPALVILAPMIPEAVAVGVGVDVGAKAEVEPEATVGAGRSCAGC